MDRTKRKRPDLDSSSPTIDGLSRSRYSSSPAQKPSNGQGFGYDYHTYNSYDYTCSWEADDEPSSTPEPTIVFEELDFTNDLQVCWNCRLPGHKIDSCPKPRNPAQIRLSSEIFRAEKETNTLRLGLDLLDAQPITPEERDRRLDLAERFIPGKVSRELARAAFWFEGEDDDRGRGRKLETGEVSWEEERRVEMDIKMRRKDWPWLAGIAKWGFPPGWIAGRDPIDTVCDRIRNMPDSSPNGEWSDDDDQGLEVIGGLGSPGPSRSSSDSGSTSPSSDMPMSPISPVLSTIPNPVVPSHKTADPLLTNGGGNQTPPPPPGAPPPPDDIPSPPSETPPPPPDLPPSPPSEPPSHLKPAAQAAKLRNPPIMRRWAYYDTDLFDSDRLMAYSETRPLPLGW